MALGSIVGMGTMTTFPNPDALTDAELDRLGDFLKSCKGGKAMNLEELDGFFSALIAGPEPVMPSEYNREVFGGEMSEVVEFSGLDEAQEILNLMMRHWNKIASTLYKGEIHVPHDLRGRERRASRQRLGSRVHAGDAHAARRLGLSLSTTRNMAAP